MSACKDECSHVQLILKITIYLILLYFTDLSDGERDLTGDTPSPSQALNYSGLGVVGPTVSGASSGTPAPSLTVASDGGVPCSTETLLRNIQGLLKVAADNARQQERQISYEKGEITQLFRHSF